MSTVVAVSDLLTPAEQAAVLGVSPSTIRRWRAEYATSPTPYPAVHVAGVWLATRAEVTAWAAARTTARTGRPRTRPPYLTVAQWRDLRALAAGQTIRGDKATTKALAHFGLVTAEDPSRAVPTQDGYDLLEEYS